MQFSTSFLFAFAALSALPLSPATPVPESVAEGLNLLARAACGTINGNCYENGCNGDSSLDGLTCTAGKYKDCPCGYGCSAKYIGPCAAYGCAGLDGSCTGDYLGCSCH